MTIREIAAKTDGECHWVAAVPDPEPKAAIAQFMRFLDSLDGKGNEP